MEKTVKIEGMMCAHCEANVKNTLEALDGVTGAEVSHETGSAVITLSKEVDDSVIEKAINDKGYKFIDTSGEVVISLDANIYVYDDFHEGLCMVSVDGKCGFIDRTGEMAIPPQFDGADSFDHGVAPVRIGEREIHCTTEIPFGRMARILVYKRRPASSSRRRRDLLF